MGVKKYVFFCSFILVSKICALMGGFRIWPHNWNRITFAPIFDQNIVENWQNTLFWQFSTVFFLSKNGFKCYLISNLRPDSAPLIKAHLLDTKLKGVKNVIFDPSKISKISYFVSFRPFLSKNGVKCYLISHLRPDSEPSHQGIF